MTDMPAALGPALLTAIYKSTPSDFQVDEVLGIDPDGDGEHWLLRIEKTGTNTDELCSLLEKACALGSADVGISGMKDRHAVTTQWISLRTPLPIETIDQALHEFNQQQQADSLTNGDAKRLTLLESHRHGRKLRRGTHQGNDFVIVLREVSARPGAEFSLVAAVEARIAELIQHGFPNYIGPQRFGRGGQNLVRAQQWFRQPRKRTSRQQRSLWLSAARSEVFNRVCSARVTNGTWQSLLPGEPAALDGSHSFFDSDTASAEDLSARLESFDIHPSAPWWGRGRSLAKAECAEFEAGVLDGLADLCAGLERNGLSQERRALRARALNLRCEWLDERSLQLRFHLSPGIFATTLLREIGLCTEPGR